MGRTIAEIQASLDGNITTVLTNPSTSQTASWKFWRDIFAYAIWVFEGILDVFKAETENLIAVSEPGTFQWWYEKALLFQGADDQGGTFQGDTLIVDSKGVVRYVTTDTTRQIIKACALNDTDVSGTIAIKVAKESSGNLVKLDADEKLAFEVYCDNIHFPGSKYSVVSNDPDVVKYALNIYYNPIYSTATVQANVLAKLTEYKSGLGFDDKIYHQKILEKIMEAAGVVSVKVLADGLQAKQAGGAYANIDVVYQLQAGYFNYDPASTLTLIDATTL